MKKMLFSAIAMVAFTLSANAQVITKEMADCAEKGFQASDQAEKDGKKGTDVSDAANKAYSDCMGGKTTTIVTKQPNTISR